MAEVYPQEESGDPEVGASLAEITRIVNQLLQTSTACYVHDANYFPETGQVCINHQVAHRGVILASIKVQLARFCFTMGNRTN